MRHGAVSTQIRRWWRYHPDEITAAHPLLIVRQGRIHSDGTRMQCLTCGLWATRLHAHLPGHEMTVDDYRHTHSLTDDQPLEVTRRA